MGMGLRTSRTSVMARRSQHTVTVVSVTLLLVATLLAGAAEADTVDCGDIITTDITLTSDVGPCPAEGLVVAADDVVLNLNGHTVSGDPSARPDQEMIGDTRDRAGILLRQVSGVTVMGGTVTGFDAGVAIMGGGGNTVRKVTAHDNVNYRLTTGEDAAPEDVDPTDGPFCWFGDGITVFNSTGNVLEHNVLIANGPFAGVSLVGDSDDNLVARNDVRDQDVLNQTPDGEATICGGLGSPGQPMQLGRRGQDVGIRIEGPGADDNQIEHNGVVRSGLGGVFVHGYVRDTGANNGGNVIRRNRIFDTGLRTYEVDYLASGITLHHAQTTRVHVSHGNLIEQNVSSRNLAAGIYAIGPWPSAGTDQFGNTIRGNVVNHNALDGILLGEGVVHTVVTGNRGHGNGWDEDRARDISETSRWENWQAVDGGDNNEGCGSNVWSRNRFATVNRPCVAAEGTGWVGGPGRSGEAGGGSGGPLRRGLPQRGE